MRLFNGNTLLLATHNHGKVEELSRLFEKYEFKILSSKDFNLAEPLETENTFKGNARIKAHFASRNTGLIALSDDSGIEVKVLNGAPGVFTADWAQTDKGRDFKHAMTKLWSAIRNTKSSGPYVAQFCCSLVMAWPDGHEEVFEKSLLVVLLIYL